MFGKGTKAYGILANKCPRCHEGEVFPNKNPYNLKEMMKVNERCDKCEQSFEPEPNFFYGAMYISYMYTTAIFMFSFVLGRYILELSATGTVILAVGLLLAFAPYVFRLSRSTWLHINVKYRKDALKKNV